MKQEGKLAVGDTVVLDEVEVFNGREWRTAAGLRMDQPRDGANIVKMPIDLL